MIAFVSENGYYGLRVPAKRGEEDRLLDIWVGYQRGDEGNFMTWEELERGFYLFLNLREKPSGYPAYSYVEDGKSMYKVLLKRVDRKRRSDAVLASRVAVKYLDRILKEVYPDLSLRMKEFRGFEWSGKGTGVGMFSGLFIPHIFQFDGLEDEYTL